ncbi:MAG: LPP20 family lipoprotein [Alkalispirochaeta sp.]|jgi:acylphosphatase
MNVRTVQRIALAVMVVFLIVGCASKPEPAPQPAAPVDTGAKVDAPDWFLMPPQADDAIYGVGTAKMSDLARSRNVATSRARNDIAFQMNAQIEAAIVDYAQESGVDDNNQVINFVETISRQTTETTLQGTQQQSAYVAQDGTVYVLVSFPKNNFLQASAEAFQRNEDAAFAEFKAQEALKMLDSQMTKNPSKAGNVKN